MLVPPVGVGGLCLRVQGAISTQLLIEIQRDGLSLPARRPPSHPAGEVPPKVNQVHPGLWLGYPQRLELIGTPSEQSAASSASVPFDQRTDSNFRSSSFI